MGIYVSVYVWLTVGELMFLDDIVTPFGLGAVVAVPSVVVHRMHATRLHGSPSRGTSCSVGSQVDQPGTLSSAVDGYTIQDPSAVAGAAVLDCRPQLLPVTMDINGVDLSVGRLLAVSADVDVIPSERGPSFGGVT